jgi:hypothetical protein
MRIVSLMRSFKETLALHMQAMREHGASHLFESSRKSGTAPVVCGQ